MKAQGSWRYPQVTTTVGKRPHGRAANGWLCDVFAGWDPEKGRFYRPANPRGAQFRPVKVSTSSRVRRNVLPTTDALDNSIASTAMIGFSTPAIANTMPSML